MLDDTHILSVSSLTRAIKGNLETAFPFVWVRGQVANLSRPSSGHVYFSLKDEESSLAAVWFKSSHQDCQRFDPLTGEVFEEGPRQSLASSLANGQEIVCAGRIAVYGQRGVYQLVVELAQEAGLGRLHEEFARLRAALESLGFFAPERKRPLPEHPRRLAVITAPQGAAIHDFLRIAQDRGLGAAIRIYPAPVQGDGAPPAIIAALRRIRDEGWAQCIVLIRGGGSIEDLWAFNDEALARAVYASPIPILAGIGHEVDFTLVDMTADLRAATPTHAAQLLWPHREELLREWRRLATALEQAEARWLARQQDRFERLLRGLEWGSPERRLAACSDRLSSALRLLAGAGRLLLEKHAARLAALYSRLEAMNPHAPLERGYALARKEDGSFVRLTGDVDPGELLRLVVSDGEIAVCVQGEN